MPAGALLLDRRPPHAAPTSRQRAGAVGCSLKAFGPRFWGQGESVWDDAGPSGCRSTQPAGLEGVGGRKLLGKGLWQSAKRFVSNDLLGRLVFLLFVGKIMDDKRSIMRNSYLSGKMDGPTQSLFFSLLSDQGSSG